MKYLHLFETTNEFDSYYNGDDYIEPFVSVVNQDESVHYNKIVDYSTEYLTFDVLSNGNIVWKANNTSVTKTIEYKKNNSEWTEITSTTAGIQIPVTTGDKVKFRGNNDSYYYNYYKACFSGTSCEFNACGNIMSLIYGNNFSGQTTFPQNSTYNFDGLFYKCTDLISAENLVLPATSLTESCYKQMFYGCSGLTTAPVLPATTLANSCYEGMFLYCSSLTTAPELPATTLARSCYMQMFQDCTSLTTAPALPATTATFNCYMDMFAGCSSLTTAPELPATILGQSSYSAMFWGCTSLTVVHDLPEFTTNGSMACKFMFLGCTSLVNAPALPSTALTSGGIYEGMFSGCTSLVNAPALPATSLTDYCYHNMFGSCTSLTTAPALPATSLTEGCYYSMFQGCTSLTTAPVLSATTVSQSGYCEMFKDCSNLNYITCLATDISASACTLDWVKNVAASGTFVLNSSMTDWSQGDSGIPNGWNLRDENNQVIDSNTYPWKPYNTGDGGDYYDPFGW